MFTMVRYAFSSDPELPPRSILLAFTAASLLGAASIAWRWLTDTEVVEDCGEGLAWRP